MKQKLFCCFFYFCNFETVHNILFHVSGSPSAMYFSLSYRTKMFATSYNKRNKKAKKKNQQNRQKGRDGKGNRGFQLYLPRLCVSIFHDILLSIFRIKWIIILLTKSTEEKQRCSSYRVLPASQKIVSKQHHHIYKYMHGFLRFD